MNADRRIVPARHVSSVLAEENISERTLGMKYMLEQSDKKLDKIANKWTAHDGINSLSRVMLQNVGRVPVKLSPIKKVIQHALPSDVHAHEEQNSHTVHEDHHNQGHYDNHSEKDYHEHGDHNNVHGDETSHHQETNHSHGHATHSHSSKSGFASFTSTGHWFGDYGAYIFGMIGRGIGEAIGYSLKLLAVMMIFGPTRTALLTMAVIVLLNIYAGTSFSVWLGAGALLIVHGLFSMIAHFNGGGGSEEHGGGGHGDANHGHGGGDEHH